MQPEINRYKELMDSLPKVETKPPEVKAPEGTLPCACGKKFIPFDEAEVVQTPFCTALDTMCRECKKDCPRHSLIVCTKCKSVVARLAPHKDKSGFVFEPGKPYHTPYCPNCEPDCVTSPLAEKMVWESERK